MNFHLPLLVYFTYTLYGKKINDTGQPNQIIINLKLPRFSNLKNTLQIQQLFTVQTCNFFY